MENKDLLDLIESFYLEAEKVYEIHFHENRLKWANAKSKTKKNIDALGGINNLKENCSLQLGNPLNNNMVGDRVGAVITKIQTK